MPLCCGFEKVLFLCLCVVCVKMGLKVGREVRLLYLPQGCGCSLSGLHTVLCFQWLSTKCHCRHSHNIGFPVLPRQFLIRVWICPHPNPLGFLQRRISSSYRGYQRTQEGKKSKLSALQIQINLTKTSSNENNFCAAIDG